MASGEIQRDGGPVQIHVQGFDQAGCATTDQHADARRRPQVSQGRGAGCRGRRVAVLENKDPWIRADVCKLLDSIGTKKSLPALEKAVADENWMVNGNARKAVAAIKARAEISEKSDSHQN